ncbi:MAG: alkaline shock response membrane anchor protein AmaP [Candidatus Omnitrophica bacterium]|nr:alkaline shock response membrane anchor protein AmaP [Candidatus Omnitrophota bacterium]
MIIIGNVLYLVFSVLIGVLFIGIALKPSFVFNLLKQNISLISNNYIISNNLRLKFGLFGILVILICLKYFETIFLSKRKEKFISINTGNGKVHITLFAIEDMLAKLLESKSELSHIKPKILLDKKSIKIVIRANLTSEVNLVEFVSAIQNQLEEKLQNMLGKEKEIKVEIEIKKMVFDKNKKLTLETEPKIPFRDY